MANARSPRQYTGVRAIQPPDLTLAKIAPSGTDTAFQRGQLWLDYVGLTTYMFSGTSWITLGSGTTGSINSITGDTGGAEVPSAGNFNLLGTANQITVTGTANTETFSIPAVFVAPGSIRSITTITSGTGITSTLGNIVASAGNISATIGSVSAGTSVTAGTTVTATLGNITATNGNFVKGTAGNKDVYTSLATTTTAGANSAGTVTLAAGTATISTTAVTASSKIRIYRQSIGATGAAATGNLSIGTITAATSFVINSVTAADATALATTDVSVVFWEIVN